MSLFINNNSGPIYNECNVTINNGQTTVETPIEDITPNEDLSSNSPESDSGSAFPYLTRKCIQEHRVEAVEAEIQAARKGTAEIMWRTLWNNENLGFLEVEPIDATTLYRAIEKWYGKLPYTERNFRGARNKR